MTRVLTDVLLGAGEPIAWVIGEGHPLATGWQIRRMFVDDNGVEVYALSADGKHGMRHLIPMARVRLVEEAMSLDVFIDELAAAEESDDDDDLEPEPEEPSAAPNEQPST